jgi:hypothetical protein
MGIEESNGRQLSFWNSVVVDNDRFDPRPARVLQSIVVARPTIARDEKRRTRISHAGKGTSREAVSALESVRYDGCDVRTHDAHHLGEESRRGDSVRVVVTKDHGPLVLSRGTGET